MDNKMPFDPSTVPVYVLPADRLHAEGPDLRTHTRLIGVELTLQYNGVEEELQMFATERTIALDNPKPSPYDHRPGLDRPRIKVTLHTSHGDKQGTIYL